MRGKTRKEKNHGCQVSWEQENEVPVALLPWCLALPLRPYSEVQPNWQLTLNLSFKSFDLHYGLELKGLFSSFFSRFFRGNGQVKYCSISPTPDALVPSNLTLPTLFTDDRVAKDKNQKRNLGLSFRWLHGGCYSLWYIILLHRMWSLLKSNVLSIAAVSG